MAVVLDGPQIALHEVDLEGRCEQIQWGRVYETASTSCMSALPPTLGACSAWQRSNAAIGGTSAFLFGLAPDGRVQMTDQSTRLPTSALGDRIATSAMTSPKPARDASGHRAANSGLSQGQPSDEVNPVSRSSIDRCPRPLPGPEAQQTVSLQTVKRHVFTGTSRVPPTGFEPVISCVKGRRPNR